MQLGLISSNYYERRKKKILKANENNDALKSNQKLFINNIIMLSLINFQPISLDANSKSHLINLA